MEGKQGVISLQKTELGSHMPVRGCWSASALSTKPPESAACGNWLQLTTSEAAIHGEQEHPEIVRCWKGHRVSRMALWFRKPHPTWPTTRFKSWTWMLKRHQAHGCPNPDRMELWRRRDCDMTVPLLSASCTCPLAKCFRK